jgi:Putative DNA-binding domain
MGSGLDAEAQRQQALLAALAVRGPAPEGLALSDQRARATQGLDAYRINAAAIAQRSLGAAFPTIDALIGAEDFEHLAHEFWRAHPPACGDLGDWGEAFPAWLETHVAFGAWPYFGDAARLDLALHRCERAADAGFDADSLAWLSQAEPDRLLLTLMPGSALIESRWPIVAIHAAHHGAEGGFDAVREALERGSPETAFVVRSGWRATVHRLEAASARWTAQLLAGATLDRALAEAGDDFDVSAWLATAVQEKWLKAAVLRTDQPLPTNHRDSP